MLRNESDDEGAKVLNGPPFDKTYLTWWHEARPYPLDLYGLEHLVEVAEAKVNEEEEEEEEERDEDMEED